MNCWTHCILLWTVEHIASYSELLNTLHPFMNCWIHCILLWTVEHIASFYDCCTHCIPFMNCRKHLSHYELLKHLSYYELLKHLSYFELLITWQPVKTGFYTETFYPKLLLYILIGLVNGEGYPSHLASWTWTNCWRSTWRNSGNHPFQTRSPDSWN